MKPWELYEYQKNLDYKTNTLDYDWRVKVENEEQTIYVFSQFSTSTLDWIVNFLFSLFRRYGVGMSTLLVLVGRPPLIHAKV